MDTKSKKYKYLKGCVYIKNKGKRYDQDFKKMIAELYNTKDYTMASLESQYGIPAGTIQRWVNQFTPVQFDNNDSMTPDDFKAFQKEMAKLREENKILKKAMPY